jgi:hypothetical protein
MTRTNHRRAGRALSLALSASMVCAAACGNTSIDVLSVRDASSEGVTDVSADETVDASVDESVDPGVDGGAEAGVDASRDGGAEAGVDASRDGSVDEGVDAGADGSVDAGSGGDGGAACRALGADCSYAGACCSLSCVVVSAPPSPRKCGTGPLCMPAEGACADNADCCANRCESNVCIGVPMGACSPAGELCSSASKCCSARCTAVDAGESRCTIGGSCRPRGETCGDQQDCCSGLCAPDSRGVQICVEADAATFAPRVNHGPPSSCGTETE